MSQDEQARIIAENLRYYLDKYGYTQREVADAIGVSHQRFSSWCQGKAIPRMGAVQAGIDQRIIDAIVGHVQSNNISLAVYTHIPPEALRDAMEKVLEIC